MNTNINFSKLTNSEINIKVLGYENEYNAKKTQIMALIHDLSELDILYNKAKQELKKRGILNDNE